MKDRWDDEQKQLATLYLSEIRLVEGIRTRVSGDASDVARAEEWSLLLVEVRRGIHAMESRYSYEKVTGLRP